MSLLDKMMISSGMMGWVFWESAIDCLWKVIYGKRGQNFWGNNKKDYYIFSVLLLLFSEIDIFMCVYVLREKNTTLFKRYKLFMKKYNFMQKKFFILTVFNIKSCYVGLGLFFTKNNTYAYKNKYLCIFMNYIFIERKNLLYCIFNYFVHVVNSKKN